MTDNTNKGFADDQRNIASEGGQSQGQETNSGNFANQNKEDVENAAHAGGEARREQGADYSELGELGGQARSEDMSDEDYAAMGQQGGESQGQETNSGNFANDREKASEAGKIDGSK